MARRTKSLLAAAVALAALAASARSLAGDLVWDDRWLVLESPAMRGGDALLRALGADYFGGADRQTRYGYYRPVSTLTLAATHAAAGGAPLPYHATNVLLHVLAAVLVFALGLRLEVPPSGAAPGAALFAVHPAAVEPVAWVSGRTDLLATTLGLAALLCLLAEPAEKRARLAARAGGALLFALALLSKESALALLPVAALLLRARPEGALPFRAVGARLALPLAIVAAYATIRLAAVPLPAAELPGTSFLERVVSALAGLARYARLFLAPLDQRPYMQVPMESSPFAPATLVGVGLVAAATLLLLRRRPGAGAGPALLACSLLALVPVLNLVRVASPRDMGFTMADRFLYMPSAFACVGLGLAASRLAASVGRRRGPALLAALALGLAALAVLSSSRAATWHDELTLFDAMVRTAPEAPMPRVLLAQALRRAGRPTEAARQIERAAAFHQLLGEEPPPGVRVTVAGLRLAQGRLAEAEALLEAPDLQALGEPAVHRDLATIYRLRGRPEGAEAQLARALALDPEAPETWLGRTLLFLAERDLDRADEAASRARELAPRSPAALQAQALVRRARGDREGAAELLARALSLGPEAEGLLYDFGVTLSELGRHEEALEALRRAAAAEPERVDVSLALAVALHRAGRAAEGTALLEELAEDHPDDPAVLRSLARARLAAGDREAALELLRRAPSDPLARSMLQQLDRTDEPSPDPGP